MDFDDIPDLYYEPSYLIVGFRHCNYLAELSKIGKETPNVLAFRDASSTLSFYTSNTKFESLFKDDFNVTMRVYTNIYHCVYPEFWNTALRIQDKLRKLNGTVKSLIDGVEIDTDSLENLVSHCTKVNEVCMKIQNALIHIH